MLRRVVRIPGLQLSDNPSQFLLPKDRRFNMSFTLAGVGSFSNFFGAFGGGTYATDYTCMLGKSVLT